MLETAQVVRFRVSSGHTMALWGTTSLLTLLHQSPPPQSWF